MTSPFELAGPLAEGQLHPADVECPCPNPDDQYLLEIDAGTVFLTHKACGKTPKQWLDDAYSLDRIPVTLRWYNGRPAHPEDDDNSYGLLRINGLTVVHEDVPYLVDRDYADRDGAVWHITDLPDAQDRPLVFLQPGGAGEYVPLAEVVADFGPLTLIPIPTSEETTA